MAMALRIVEWEGYYECSGRPPSGAMKWVPLRVYGHRAGTGYRRLIEEADDPAAGAIAFAVFCKLLELAADERRELRGWILDERGDPATVETVAYMIFLPVGLVAQAIRDLEARRWIGWLEYQPVAVPAEKCKARADVYTLATVCKTMQSTGQDRTEQDNNNNNSSNSGEKTTATALWSITGGGVCCPVVEEPAVVAAFLRSFGMGGKAAENCSQLPGATLDQARVAVANADHLAGAGKLRVSRAAYIRSAIRHGYEPLTQIARSAAAGEAVLVSRDAAALARQGELRDRDLVLDARTRYEAFLARLPPVDLEQLVDDAMAAMPPGVLANLNGHRDPAAFPLRSYAMGIWKTRYSETDHANDCGKLLCKGGR